MTGQVAGNAARRDFLILATTAFGAASTAAALVPFVASMNPAADVLAAGTLEVDIGAIAVGQAVTVTWRGKPVFIRRRSEAEIVRAVAEDSTPLRAPAPDASRVQQAEWLVVEGVCTHLGCVPLGQKPGDPRGEFGGWFCPCHGSHYDTSGRIRKGPAPLNLPVPPYAFTSPTALRIG
ncbi:MAG: ubiquinol-cytochrome c reductase iron-sulfur subunit [Magnetospirillum sp.]|nr:ubiquinol-cytochrome c reductase iron-sulfur subunit [Magnetospirillum sp.]